MEDMEDDDREFDWDELRYDLEGTEKSRPAVGQFFARWVSVFRDTAAPPGRGARLMQRCAADNRTRYRSLLHFETNPPPDFNDYGFLIGPACQILESELDHKVTGPARAFAPQLCAALQGNKRDREKAEILAAWAAGTMPTTIGVQSLVLFALGRARAGGDPHVRGFLDSRFGPGYPELLDTKKPGACLDHIRQQFRNPVSHAQCTFERADYERFCGLVVGNRRFGAWDADGPDPSAPGPDVGVLYHHLVHARVANGGQVIRIRFDRRAGVTRPPLAASRIGRLGRASSKPDPYHPGNRTAAHRSPGRRRRPRCRRYRLDQTDRVRRRREPGRPVIGPGDPPGIGTSRSTTSAPRGGVAPTGGARTGSGRSW